MTEDLYRQFIYKSRYSRYLPEKNRRENWDETVNRYLDFILNHISKNNHVTIDDKLRQELYDHIYDHKDMPSMRALMTAGKAAERDNTCIYNCSYLPIDDPKAFDEAMHILMCGVGVGFSVERQYINQLPEIPDKIYDSDTVIVVKDSKEGWAKSLRMLIALLYSGEVPSWDLSKLRPAGTPLKTFGGRSSGPEPLNDLFKFVVRIFKNAKGRKLNSLECHDIMCKIGEVVVVGGVRRCLPGFYEVKTESGWKKIKDMTVQDKVVLPEGNFNVKNVFEQGRQETVKIKTPNGHHVSTPNHHWLAYDNDNEKVVWVTANDIETNAKGRFSLLKPKQ